MANTPFQSGDRVVFIGDSITSGGRNDPGADPMGNSYVTVIRGILSARFADLRIEIVNRGRGGDRTIELLERLNSECLDLKPTWVSIKIGVNDVWRKRQEWNNQSHVPLSEFTANLGKAAERVLAAGVRRLVLVAPTTIDDDPESDLNLMLADYDQSVQSLARKYGAIYVPARKRLWQAMKTAPGMRWTRDGCHPTMAGHSVIAIAWLEAVGVM